MAKKITWKDRFDFFVFGWIVNLAYPQYYRPRYGYTRYYKLFFYYVIPQKLLGINRDVPWPVHFTSRVTGAHKIKKGIICDPGDSIGVYIQAVNGIEFGNNVGISPGCKIISANHTGINHSQHDEDRPIKFGNHVFIYANSVVLPGVSIGDNVIIGAGSVVSKDIPSNSVAVGNPCRVIKPNPPYEEGFQDTLFNRRIPLRFQEFINEK